MVSFTSTRTVRWEKGRVILIDQTRLPTTLRYVRCSDHLEVADAIRKMVVRGAPAIGVAAAMGLALVAYNSHAKTRDQLIKELNSASEVLRQTRPTAFNLFWGLNRILDRAKNSGEDVEKIRNIVIKVAQLMAEEDVQLNRRIGEYGAELIEDGDVVLTHCNAGALATVGYGTALGVIRAAREEGKCVKVIATETRPALQGSRLTAFELREDGFDTTLISDTMVGYVMNRGLIDKVIVGADRITSTGHLFNKIGTYQIAVLAQAHKIPFYSAAPSSTFDLTNDWRNIVIEERGIEEVVKIGRKRISPKAIKIINPAFDITPPELIKTFITDRGILEPPFKETISRNLSQPNSSIKL